MPGKLIIVLEILDFDPSIQIFAFLNFDLWLLALLFALSKSIHD